MGMSVFLSEQKIAKINIARRAYSNDASDDLLRLLNHIDGLEMVLDEVDATGHWVAHRSKDGWRAYVGIE